MPPQIWRATMPSHPEFNHDALLPALEALPYVNGVRVEPTDRECDCIVLDIDDEGRGPVMYDLSRLAERHKVVRTKSVSTCISLDKQAGTATLTPA
jgi:hypothetical protein